MRQSIQAAADAAIGVGGVTSPTWLPAIYEINLIAGCVAAVGGALLIVIRIYFVLNRWDEYRKRGKLPNID